MKIEINNKTKQKINTKILKAAAGVVSRRFKLKDTSVSVAIIGDKAIKALNKQYLGKNKPTDVLSFTDGQEGHLGEVIMSYERIKKQAQKLKHSATYELTFIFIHGLLHLIGYDDKTQAGWIEMEALGGNLCTKAIRKKRLKVV